MSKEELKEMLKLYTKQDLWEFNQIKAKKQIELMAQIKEKDQKIADLEAKLAESEKLKDDAMYNYAWLNQDLSDTKEQLKIEKDAYKIFSDNYNTLSSAYDQLKQQLAEKEKYTYTGKEVGDIERNYEQQLAEKDELYRTCCEQCERIKDKLGIITSYNQDLQNEILDKHKTNEKLKKSQNQTAIDELEKIISYLSDRTDVINDELKNFDRDEISVRFAVQKRLITDIFYVIDQQIKELKGEMLYVK